MTEEEAKAWLEERWGREKLELLDRFVALLRAENSEQNLVSAKSLTEVWARHIVDSAQLLELISRSSRLGWIDIGSGAGLPGLVISVLEPSIEMTLVEPRARRVDWLARANAELGLANCTVEPSKIERLKPFAADVISARAVAPLWQLLLWGAPFSAPSTRWLLPKGRNARQEINDLPPNSQPMFHVEQSLTDTDAGIIVGIGQYKEPLP